MPPHPSESPAKKQSKWSPEEDAVIIDLRGSGMKWEDISKRLPGRSAISCRLHYQNYLERRSEWDEDRKSKLARLYERFKPEMWSKVAEEMGVPWRAAEAMHWQLGEAEMARRAGVVPFSLSSTNLDSAPGLPRAIHTPSRGLGHSYSHSHVGAPSSLTGHGPGSGPSSSAPYPRTIHSRGGAAARSIAARRESTPRSVPPSSSAESIVLAGIRQPMGMGPGSGGGGGGGGRQMLPSVLEMTTRVSPYNTPAYAVSSSAASGYASPGPLLPAQGYLEGTRPRTTLPEGKRGLSPPDVEREAARRGQYE